MYELWSRQSGNRLAESDSVDEALALVREYANDYGVEWARSLVLGEAVDGARPTRLLAGIELLERAGIRMRAAV